MATHHLNRLMRYWRERSGLNRTQLAAQLGISEGTARNWETEGSPRARQIPEIAKVFGVTLSEFYEPADMLEQEEAKA